MLKNVDALCVCVWYHSAKPFNAYKWLFYVLIVFFFIFNSEDSSYLSLRISFIAFVPSFIITDFFFSTVFLWLTFLLPACLLSLIRSSYCWCSDVAIISIAAVTASHEKYITLHLSGHGHARLPAQSLTNWSSISPWPRFLFSFFFLLLIFSLSSSWLPYFY